MSTPAVQRVCIITGRSLSMRSAGISILEPIQFAGEVQAHDTISCNDCTSGGLQRCSEDHCHLVFSPSEGDRKGGPSHTPYGRDENQDRLAVLLQRQPGLAGLPPNNLNTEHISEGSPIIGLISHALGSATGHQTDHQDPERSPKLG